MTDKIRLSKDDLYSPSVDSVISEQRSLNHGNVTVGNTASWRKIVFSSLFFLSIAGSLGGFVGWLVIEPLLNEAIRFAGEIEQAEMVMQGDTQNLRIVVRDQVITLSDRVTAIVGSNEYKNITSVRHLAVGQPVLVSAMILDEGELYLFGTRVEVGEQPLEKLHEPMPDLVAVKKWNFIGGLFCFAVVGACIAGFIAAADAIVSRNLLRGLFCAISGIGIAAIGGIIGLVPAGVVFRLAEAAVNHLNDGVWTSGTVGGLGLLVLIVGRSLTWGVYGLSVGLGQGVALRSRQLIMNGLLGGTLGGLVGGALFDPVDHVFNMIGFSGEAVLSRGVGFTLVGLSTGLLIGLVEHFAKDAWLLMRGGPLAGKEFIIHKSPTILGSSPKCDIYLFKDPDVDPRHAQIRKVGNRHEIIDLGSRAGVLVNGQAIERLTLQGGDLIVIGETILEYSGRALR